jgi:hypothetical protein
VAFLLSNLDYSFNWLLYPIKYIGFQPHAHTSVLVDYLWWSTIQPISRKRTITSHLNTRKTTACDVGNPGPSLGQAQNCGGFKPVNGIFVWITNISEMWSRYVPNSDINDAIKKVVCLNWSYEPQSCCYAPNLQYIN